MRSHETGREDSHGKWVFRLIALSVVIALGLIVHNYLNFLSTPIDPSAEEPVMVKIPRGSFKDVTETLEEHGLIDHPLFFQFYAGLSGKGREIKAGTFFLDPRWTPTELLDNLVEGALRATRIVKINSGLNMWRIANRVDDAEIATRTDFLEAMGDWEHAQSLGLPVRKPDPKRWGKNDLSYVSAFEGYLLPGSYELDWNVTAEEFVTTAAKRFRETWEELKSTHRRSREALQKELELDDHDMIILASIVEKEAILDEERPLIAGVFYNRLRHGWRLDTDPSLTYHPNHYQKRPSKKLRLNRSNAYNTYKFPGLPPGPIANPGRASLEAVLTPTETEYYFFVAKQDGSRKHAFAKDLTQHRKNIDTYLKGK